MSAADQDARDVEQLLEPSRAAKRIEDEQVVYTYKIPPKMRAVKVAGYGVVKTVGLVELEPADELMAATRARQDPVKLAYELASQSLRYINGKPVGYGDSSIDLAWKQLGPQLRTLVMTAYGEIHQPTKEVTQDFLGSVEVGVGR